jgi:hypothetical protein
LDDEDDKISNLYLETSSGIPVSRDLMVKVGHKAQRLWQALMMESLAPESWHKASKTIYTYFIGEMLNKPEFEFFRYGEGNWKIDHWAGRAYSSWKRNHLKDHADDSNKKSLKWKQEMLDDPDLLQIASDTEVHTVLDSGYQIPPKVEGPSSNTSSSSLSSLVHLLCPIHA